MNVEQAFISVLSQFPSRALLALESGSTLEPLSQRKIPGLL
jgi:hypothetical protein